MFCSPFCLSLRLRQNLITTSSKSSVIYYQVPKANCAEGYVGKVAGVQHRPLLPLWEDGATTTHVNSDHQQTVADRYGAALSLGALPSLLPVGGKTAQFPCNRIICWMQELLEYKQGYGRIKEANWLPRAKYWKISPSPNALLIYWYI